MGLADLCVVKCSSLPYTLSVQSQKGINYKYMLKYVSNSILDFIIGSIIVNKLLMSLMVLTFSLFSKYDIY